MDAAIPLQGFLQSLGWAILHSFWQMALLWLAYQVLFGWRNRISPTLRHNAAFLMLTGGSVWFLFTFGKEYTKFWQVDRYLSRIPDAETATPALTTTGTGAWEIRQILTDFAETNITYISALYLVILSLMAWKLLQGFLQTKALRREGLVPAGTQLESQLSILSRKLGIPREVRVYISQLVDVPATLGFIKPIILLPVASLTQLSPSQLESILLHELAHIRRMDYLVNIGVALMETLQFHNPFAWLLVRAIRRERELCCDDVVLSCRQDALDYASALLSLEKSRHMPALSMALASNGRKGQLLHRVRRITSMPAVRKPYADRLLAIGLTFLLMLSMAWMKPANTQAHTMYNLVTTKLVEEQKVLILREPQQNLLEKPRSKSLVLALKEKKQSASPNTVITDDERLSLSPWETVLSPVRTPVYVNEAPPEGFRFLLEETPHGIKSADILWELTNEAELEDQLMQNQARERAMAIQDQRMQTIELEKLVEKNGNIFSYRNHADPEQQVIVREFRNAAKARVNRQPFPGTRSRSQEPSRRPSVLATAPEPPPHLLAENEFRALADELRKEQFFLLQEELPGISGQPKKPVKVNRVKTKDGYSLRIETGKESIDIRIEADDIIVEKH